MKDETGKQIKSIRKQMRNEPPKVKLKKVATVGVEAPKGNLEIQVSLFSVHYSQEDANKIVLHLRKAMEGFVYE